MTHVSQNIIHWINRLIIYLSVWCVYLEGSYHTIILYDNLWWRCSLGIILFFGLFGLKSILKEYVK